VTARLIAALYTLPEVDKVVGGAHLHKPLAALWAEHHVIALLREPAKNESLELVGEGVRG
jgi:hypothetical protein